jgi:hypothetical protein
MNDDGSDPRELISPSAAALASSLPDGTLAEPDIFENGGTTILFQGLTSAFAGASLPAACGADCAGTYELNNGLLTQLGPRAASAAGAAYYESQPRLTADGQEVFGSTLYTGISPTTPGTAATALVERPLAPDATVTQWSNTNAETEPAAGFDGTPDPADATLAAWVQAQGCAYSVPNAQGAAQSSCQYAIHVGSATQAAPPVAIYDNEFVSANGRGPSSLDLSSDGSTLLLVDPYPPNTGIYMTSVAGAPGEKPVTEVLAQPAGWTFGQARFAGTNIVFDAHQLLDGKTTGDIYTLRASCSVGSGCTFPASATDLTHDPLADGSDPAWTSATAPIAALRAVTPRIRGVSAPSAPIYQGRRFTLVVQLSAPAKIVVGISRRAGASTKLKTVGSLAFTCHEGTNRLSIELVGGRALTAGSYIATVAVRGSSAAAAAVRFTVRP